MKNICPTETDIEGNDWCKYPERSFCYYKDKKNNNTISCYSVSDVLGIINSSFTGGGEDAILLQLPRDPYTRKVFTEEFIKQYLRQFRLLQSLRDLAYPEVAYFLRNYKKFYADPNIKPFLKKSILTNQEKWKVSRAIEEFLTKTNEIEHGWTDGHVRWWFWVDEDNEPTNKIDYIFNK